jgi:uncharacterized membrane protein
MKEKVLKITIFIMAANALLQLALSQVHIQTITKIFAPEVGFFLFATILFGLVTLFNLTNLKTSNNDFLLIFCSLLVTIVGVIYVRMILNDFRVQDSVTFQDISKSLYLISASVVIYAVGTIIVLVTKRQINHSQQV